ncbi:MAG: hypothetical protein HKN11_19460 [Rhizobiales bacterium]|nr:hypothetical protein [Hyphomicrobiales bacterium]
MAILQYSIGETAGVLALPATSSQAETIDDFANRVRSAHTADDKHQAIKSLFNLQGMDDELIAMYDKQTIPMLLRRPELVMPSDGLTWSIKRFLAGKKRSMVLVQPDRGDFA